MLVLFFLMGLVDATGMLVRKHRANTTHFTYLNTSLCRYPGAGMTQAPADGSGPDGTVDGAAVNTGIFKDGYWFVDCKTDAMYDQGDKHGDGASRFEGGLTHGTSIVRYDVIHDRETQKPMTPQVCFDFCRTVEGMQFFGLTEGRTCYCMHFYKQKPGDGVCDLPCEGDSAVTCGGKTKSSLYQMHECEGQFEGKWDDFLDSFDDFEDALDDQEDWSDSAQDYLEDSADDIEDEGIAEGSTSKIVQHLYTSAAKHTRDDDNMDAQEDIMFDLLDAFEDKDLDPTDGSAEARTAGEAFMRRAQAWMKTTQGVIDEAAARTETAQPRAIWGGQDWDNTPQPAQAARDSFATYEPIVQDKDAVCGGDYTGEPKARLKTAEQCAWACDLEAHKGSDNYCVAFQYLDGSAYGGDPICILFREVTELTTYACDSFKKYEPWIPVMDEEKFLDASMRRRRRRRRSGVDWYGNDDDGYGPRCYVRHTDFLPAVKEVVKEATPIDRCYDGDTVLLAANSTQKGQPTVKTARHHKHQKKSHKGVTHVSAGRRLRRLSAR